MGAWRGRCGTTGLTVRTLPFANGEDPSEKLLDETTLFLHRVAADLPAEQQEMLRMIHDKETILADKNVLVVDDDNRLVGALNMHDLLRAGVV